MDKIKFSCASSKKLNGSEVVSNYKEIDGEFRIKSKMHHYKQLYNVPVRQYVNLVWSLNDKLSSPLSEAVLVLIIKNGLLHKYSKLFSYDVPRTCAELVQSCEAMEETHFDSSQPRHKGRTFGRNRSSQLAAISQRTADIANRACFRCNQNGHFAKNCNIGSSNSASRRSPRWKKPDHNRANVLPDLSKPPPSQFNRNQKNF